MLRELTVQAAKTPNVAIEETTRVIKLARVDKLLEVGTLAEDEID